MSSIKTSLNKSFNSILIFFAYWVMLHAIIAAHSNFFPLITQLLSRMPWYLFFALTCMTSFIHFTCKDALENLFSIDLKSKISLKQALHAMSMFVPSKQKWLMALAGIYFLTCGSMLSGLLASFFSFQNDFAKWVLYIAFLSVVLFFLKQLVSTWAKSYLNVYGA